jgi:hypothetical protein
MFTYNIGKQPDRSRECIRFSFLWSDTAGVFLVAFLLKHIRNGHVVFLGCRISRIARADDLYPYKTGVFKMDSFG